MADISTGRQRGIVPFVDETTGRLPDQYLPQGVIDLQGDLKQAVTDASQSATAAKASETSAKASADSATQSASAAAQSAESASGDASAAKTSADGAASSASAAKASETAASSSATAAAGSEAAAKASETAAARSAQTATEQVSSIGDSVERAAASATAAQQSASQAQSNATAANSSAQAAAVSAESAQTATESAASSKDAAAQSASEASESAQAAETSKTNAAASASAAETSKTNAAASASAAKASETNAAASATAAQQAVDGFGLEAGTTTTGEPGSDAAVEIQKTGTKYTANFTIPRGDKGADGVNENVPLGTTSGVVAHASDAYPALPRKVRVHGRTINNLWVNPTGSSGGFTASQNADGSLHISGTGDSNASIGMTVTLSPSTQYTLACNEPAMNIRGFMVRENLSTGGNLDHVVAGSDASEKLTNTFTTSPDLASVGLYVLFSGGQTVNDDYKLMLVEGDTVPGAFVPSGVNTVEPTKLVIAGKNLLQIRDDMSTTEVNGVTFTPNTDKTVNIDGRTTESANYYTVGTSWNNRVTANLAKTKYVFSCNVGANFYVRDSSLNSALASTSTSGGTDSIDLTTIGELKDEICYFRLPKDTDFSGKYYTQLEYGDTATDYEKPNITVIDLPSDISLADGDTLAIDRDGTTRIVHAEGEPTVLENVTLTELPAPTFNVYTTGGSIQPTVDVDYEKDVNLVLEALEAKIAALQMADKTN